MLENQKKVNVGRFEDNERRPSKSKSKSSEKKKERINSISEKSPQEYIQQISIMVNGNETAKPKNAQNRNIDNEIKK